MLRLVRTVGAVIMVAVLASCSSSGFRTSNDEFARSLEMAVTDGQPIRLLSLTDFTWDRLMVFRDRWRGSDINTVAAVHVMDDDYYLEENLLLWVFLQDHRVVATRLNGYTGLLVGLPFQSTWSRSVWLVPGSDGSGRMTLSESDASHPSAFVWDTTSAS